MSDDRWSSKSQEIDPIQNIPARKVIEFPNSAIKQKSNACKQTTLQQAFTSQKLINTVSYIFIVWIEDDVYAIGKNSPSPLISITSTTFRYSCVIELRNF